MAACHKHPDVYAIRQLHDKGEKEGQYGLWCPACREWCDECEKKKATIELKQGQDER